MRGQRRAGRGEASALLTGVLAMPSWPEECIDWPFARDTHGYGNFTLNRTMLSVHALACEHRHGPRPEGMEARHLCGRGSSGCFNPAHLEWASHAVNMADVVPHGSHTRGERNAQHKLTEADVLAIRRMYVGRGGPSQRAIADQYGVSFQHVNQIISGDRWAWLDCGVEDPETP